MRKHALSSAISFILFSGLSTSLMATTNNTPVDDAHSNVLPIISLKANAKDAQTVATHASSALKSDTPLFETAQSVSVITRN